MCLVASGVLLRSLSIKVSDGPPITARLTVKSKILAAAAGFLVRSYQPMVVEIWDASEEGEWCYWSIRKANMEGTRCGPSGGTCSSRLPWPLMKTYWWLFCCVTNSFKGFSIEIFQTMGPLPVARRNFMSGFGEAIWLVKSPGHTHQCPMVGDLSGRWREHWHCYGCIEMR